MNTIIYTRGHSKEQQKAICEEYARANGLDVIGIADKEETLNIEVLGGGIECVIVSEASRISRNRSEYIEAEKMLNKFGVKLVAVGGRP